MKQIFHRIKNILKSELSDIENLSTNINLDFDDDLKRQFENLQNQNYNKNSDFKFNLTSLDNAFKILEIPENASIEEIKQAYIKKIKEYHPDKVSNLGKDLQKLAEMKTKEINEAFNLIRKMKGF